MTSFFYFVPKKGVLAGTPYFYALFQTHYFLTSKLFSLVSSAKVRVVRTVGDGADGRIRVRRVAGDAYVM